MQVPVEECKRLHGSGAGWDPTEAPSERSEASARSGRTAGGRREANSGAGHGQGAGRGVIIPMPSRHDLGTAHLDPPPLARVALSAGQPEPARQQREAPGLHGRQQHLSAVWDLAVEAQGLQADLHIPFPCPLVIRGGSNLPTGQELLGMFAYTGGCRRGWRGLGRRGR